MKLHVVLVEPEIPQNTGNIARTCAAVGATLHLVHPLGFRTDDRSVRRAGLDYWDMVEVSEYESISSFLAKHREKQLYLFSRKGTTLHTAVRFANESFLVFGRETTGLPANLLDSDLGPTIRIPIRDAARCLNLSNAVAVGVYEALRQHGFEELADRATTSGAQSSNTYGGST